MDNSGVPKTIIVDIDGTILNQLSNLHTTITERKSQYVLPGVIEKFEHWKNFGHYILLITARPKSLQKMTEEQLLELGVFYDEIIFGVTHGERVLINNTKSSYYGECCYHPEINDPIEQYYYQTARAFTVKKDAGITDVNIDEPALSFIRKE